MEKFVKSENFIKVLVMVIVAVMWLGSMFGLYGYAISGSDDNTATSKVDIEINGIDTDNEVSVETVPEDVVEETRVLLVDASGSMDENSAHGITGYDTTHTFGDYIGQQTGNSLICTNVDRVLSMGVKELGVVTDLESHPESDLEVLEDKKYENVELTFFVPEDVNQEYIKTYKALFKKALNEDNSSLIFVNADGSQLVVFDNYNAETNEEVVEETVNKADDKNISVKVEADSNGGNSGTIFAAVLMILFSIIMALIEVILVIALRNSREKEVVTTVPGEIKEALKNATAMDGSGSVSKIYQRLIAWARAEKVEKVYRFADNVEKLTLDEAEKTPAGGYTNGWECLRQMFADGEKVITIVSDMQFSDTEIDGISFEHINFVVPADYNHETVNKIAKITKTYKVISV